MTVDNTHSGDAHYEAKAWDSSFDSDTRLYLGTTYNYSFDVKLDWGSDTPWYSGWFIVHQLWQNNTPGSASPPFAIHVKSNGIFYMKIQNTDNNASPLLGLEFFASFWLTFHEPIQRGMVSMQS